jgi:hypothetical protein
MSWKNPREQARDLRRGPLHRDPHPLSDLGIREPTKDIGENRVLGIDQWGAQLTRQQVSRHTLSSCRIDQRLARADPSNRRDDVRVARQLDDVPRSPREHGSGQGLVVIGRREQQAGDRRVDRPHRPADLDTGAVLESQVQHHHVGLEIENGSHGISGRPGIADDVDVRCRHQQVSQAPPDQVMVVHEVDPQVSPDVTRHQPVLLQWPLSSPPTITAWLPARLSQGDVTGRRIADD